jgi:hypothetical protein
VVVGRRAGCAGPWKPKYFPIPRPDRGSPYDPAVLEDGTYDVVVVDATADDDPDRVHLSVTILAGDHKGEVLELVASGLGREDWDLLAVPGTVVVEGGTPRLTLEG